MLKEESCITCVNFRKIASHLLPLLIFSVLAAGSVDSDESSSSSNSSSGESAEVKEKVTPVGTFSAVRGDRSIAITNTEVYTTIYANNQFMDPVTSKGGKLIGVFLAIKNTGKESGNMFWTSFQLIDDQGRKYDDIEDFTEILTINNWSESLGLADSGDQLFPGATAKTVLVFRVAPDASGLKLSVNDKLFAI